MERDFRGAIEPHRNYRAASTNRCIGNHITVLPWARTHVAWQDRRQSDRNPPWEAKLPTVGVPAEEQAEIGIKTPAGRLRACAIAGSKNSRTEFRLQPSQYCPRGNSARHRYRPGKCVDCLAQLPDFRLAAFGCPCPPGRAPFELCRDCPARRRSVF